MTKKIQDINHLEEVYSRRLKAYKAMSNPVRLYILDILHDTTLCAGEINQLIQIDKSTLSKHLSILTNAGLISSQKVGNQVFFQLLTPCIWNEIQCLNRVLKSPSGKTI